MCSQKLSYLLLTILLLNLTSLIVITDTRLNGTKESELSNSLLDDWKEDAHISKIRRQSYISDVLLPSTRGRPLKGHAPPSTPPTGYVEKYVDALTDYHTPSDVGIIDDWTKMQAKDGDYGNLAEGVGTTIETNWHSPNSVENIDNFNTPENLYSSDDEYCWASTGGAYVTAYNFSFPDLTEAIITGINVSVEAKMSSAGSSTVFIRLMWNSRNSKTEAKSQDFPTEETIKFYGGPSNTWDRSWDGRDFNISNFGVEITNSERIYIDQVQVKIHYRAFRFDREFSFDPPPLYDEEQELCIKTGTLANEDLNVDLWNSSASTWISILNLQNSDSDSWKNVSLTSYLPNSNFHFRFVDGMSTTDYTNDTWQIDAVLIKYKLSAANFLYRRNITLDQVAATLTNFPVLIELEDAGLHDHAQENGTDILFAHSSGIKLAHELETFNDNGTHAHLLAWVKVPTLSSTSDTLISMYFGNKTTITNQANPTAVWEEGYLAVHHMEEDPSGSISDSTGNSYNMNSNGAMDSTDLVAAIIDQGVEFDKGLDQYYSSQDMLNVTASFTFSLWLNLRSSDGNQTLVTVGEDPALPHKGLIISNTNMLMFTSFGYNHSFGSLSASTWYHLFLVYNNATSELKAYVNGTQFGTTDSIELASILSEFFFAGSQFFDRLNGTLDEVRLSEVARSPAWISAAYQNQGEPSNFYSIGLEEHMEDLDPPEVVAFGVVDPGNGQPEFWAEVIDDFSGVMNADITLNSTKYEMSLNGSGYWVYQPASVNFNDYFSYFVNCSDFEGHLSPNTATKNVRFDKDTVAPTIEQPIFIPGSGLNGTFIANVSDWGIIHTVMVNVTEMASSPTALSAVMRNTTSGYVNDTLILERGIIRFEIIANDTMGNTITSAPEDGYVGINDAPMADNLTLTDPVHSNETLYLDYDFSDPNGDEEGATERRWYKNGILQPEHDDTTSITATYLFKGDQWNVTVRPKDYQLYGPLEASNTVVIQNTLPMVSDVHFILEHRGIAPFDNNRDFVMVDSPLNLIYTFFDADPTDSDESTINWYLNGDLQSQYTNWTTIPASIAVPRDIWQVEIIPHDGEEPSPAIWSKSVTVESRPMIHAYGVRALKNEEEGVYYIWIQTDDVLRDLDEVEYELCINNLVVDGEPYIYRQSNYVTNGTAQMWVLEFHLLDLLRTLPNYSVANFTDLLNTNITINVEVSTHVIYSSTEYTIWEEFSFNFTLTDEAPPRVLDAGVDWKGASPTNVTFWTILSEYGLGIDEVLLYYEFRPIDTQTKLFDLSHGPILMVFNGTHYVATVAFSPDQSYEILFQLSVLDLAGNSNPNAYPLGLNPSNRADGRFTPPPPDITLLLIIGVIIIAIIGVAAVVGVRVFRKTELVGLDISKVMEASQEVPQEEIIKAMSGHTLGIVISRFDQLHGPIPLFVDPPILKDNFEKLIELSDRAFSAVRFVDDFEREIYTAFEIDFGIIAASISYGFSLKRPEARGGAENISLNILIHKPYDALIAKFADAYADDVHQIHILMNKDTSENEEIARLVEKIRKVITAIILAYEELYGSVEDFTLD